MAIEVNGKMIEIDEEGFLVDRDDWSEDVSEAIANRDGIELKDEHMGLIDYFRDYYEEHQVHPTMHVLVQRIGGKIGKKFHEHKEYEKFLYMLFPSDPVSELCKLAGLPKPLPSEHDG